MAKKRSWATKLKPASGWPAVLWELGIVTAGVFIALFVQEWVNDRMADDRRERSMEQLRLQDANNYRNQVERYVALPCIEAQLEGVRNYLIARANPANTLPLHQDAYMSFVVRSPYRPFDTSTWKAMSDDGTLALLDTKSRNELASLYFGIDRVNALTDRTDDALAILNILARPYRIDEVSRSRLLVTLEQAERDIDVTRIWLTRNLQRMDRLGLRPDQAYIDERIERSSATLAFCRDNGLPLDRWNPPQHSSQSIN
jgi:hypothetical protein